MSKKTAVTEWIDDRLKADPRLAREVDEILSEMRLEQDLARSRSGSGRARPRWRPSRARA